MELNLITHNPNKVREFRLALEPRIKVNHLDFEYPELRSDDPTEIVRVAAKTLAERLNKTIVVEDSGLFVDALKEFPGTCTAYIHKRIGNEGIIRLMKGQKNRKCFYKSAIGYCEPGHEPIATLGVEEGTIASEISGTNGWGQDPIFIPKQPNGNTKTYGQLRKNDGKDVNLFRKDAIEKLKKILGSQK